MRGGVFSWRECYGEVNCGRWGLHPSPLRRRGLSEANFKRLQLPATTPSYRGSWGMGKVGATGAALAGFRDPGSRLYRRDAVIMSFCTGYLLASNHAWFYCLAILSL